LLTRLRCYVPSTTVSLLILIVGYVALHGVATRHFAGLGLATEIVIGLGLAGLSAGTVVISAVLIQRRRAAAGACHACSHPCRGAIVPSPEIDARQWPHRSLYLPGGRPPVPPGVRAGGADRKGRELISPARPDEKPRGSLNPSRENHRTYASTHPDEEPRRSLNPDRENHVVYVPGRPDGEPRRFPKPDTENRAARVPAQADG
jgi:hypothetical protein